MRASHRRCAEYGLRAGKRQRRDTQKERHAVVNIIGLVYLMLIQSDIVFQGEFVEVF